MSHKIGKPKKLEWGFHVGKSGSEIFMPKKENYELEEILIILEETFRFQAAVISLLRISAEKKK